MKATHDDHAHVSRAAYMRAYGQRPAAKATAREGARRRADANRARVDAILGRVCAHCGSTDRLEIDHIDPRSKAFSIGSRWGARWELLAAEVAKCQHLCHECHWAKTLAERAYPWNGNSATEGT